MESKQQNWAFHRAFLLSLTSPRHQLLQRLASSFRPSSAVVPPPNYPATVVLEWGELALLRERGAKVLSDEKATEAYIRQLKWWQLSSQQLQIKTIERRGNLLFPFLAVQVLRHRLKQKPQELILLFDFRREVIAELWEGKGGQQFHFMQVKKANLGYHLKQFYLQIDQQTFQYQLLYHNSAALIVDLVDLILWMNFIKHVQLNPNYVTAKTPPRPPKLLVITTDNILPRQRCLSAECRVKKRGDRFEGRVVVGPSNFLILKEETLAFIMPLRKTELLKSKYKNRIKLNAFQDIIKLDFELQTTASAIRQALQKPPSYQFQWIKMPWRRLDQFEQALEQSDYKFSISTTQD